MNYFTPQTTFMQYDRDRSGTMEPGELQQALVTFGYNLSPQAFGILIRRYANQGRITFDAFVGLCVRLRAVTCEWVGLGLDLENGNHESVLKVFRLFCCVFIIIISIAVFYAKLYFNVKKNGPILCFNRGKKA